MMTSGEVVRIAGDTRLELSIVWPERGLEILLKYDAIVMAQQVGFEKFLIPDRLHPAVSRLMVHLGMTVRRDLGKELLGCTQAFFELAVTRCVVRGVIAMVGALYPEVRNPEMIAMLAGGKNSEEGAKLLLQRCPFLFPVWWHLGGPKDGEDVTVEFPPGQFPEIRMRLPDLLPHRLDDRASPLDEPVQVQVRIGVYKPRDGSDIENRVLRWQGEQ